MAPLRETLLARAQEVCACVERHARAREINAQSSAEHLVPTTVRAYFPTANRPVRPQRRGRLSCGGRHSWSPSVDLLSGVRPRPAFTSSRRPNPHASITVTRTHERCPPKPKFSWNAYQRRGEAAFIVVRCCNDVRQCPEAAISLPHQRQHGYSRVRVGVTGAAQEESAFRPLESGGMLRILLQVAFSSKSPPRLGWNGRSHCPDPHLQEIRWIAPPLRNREQQDVKE